MLLAKAATYLDSNAGAPLKSQVREALCSLFSGESGVLIPNPSSIHSHGRFAKRVLADAREKIARSLGPNTDPEQLVFTSSGSEANQLAIRSVLGPRLSRGDKPHWITTPMEHDSNLQMANWVTQSGGKVSFLRVNPDGTPDILSISELLCPETALVSLVWVNNETGVISDLPAMTQKLQGLSIPLHVDAAQAWGKLPMDEQRIHAQFLTFSAHKIGGLAGAGGLYLERGNSVSAAILGKQEKGRRGGTENLLGIMAMGVAAGELKPQEWAGRVAPVRDRLQQEICQRIEGVQVNGSQAARVANTLNLSFKGVEGEGLVLALDLAGYCVSSGSACSSGVLAPSHVLLAMGLTRAQAMSAVRVSLADELPWEVLSGFVLALEKAVSRVRGVRSVP